MSTLYKYRLYSLTDNDWKFMWSENTPTGYSGHTINMDSIAYLEKINTDLITSSDSPYLLKRNGLVCDTTNGDITVRLPKVSRNRHINIIIHKRVAANSVTIDAHGSELIDSNATVTLTDENESIMIESNGTEWITVDLNASNTIKEDDSDIIFSQAKGDLLVDNGNDVDLLSLGTDGQYLKVDTTAELGMTWYSRNYLQLINVGGSIPFNTNKSWTDIYWDTEVRKDSIFTHSEVDTNGNITINKSGWFEFCVDISIEHYQSNSRTVSEIKLNRNGSEHPGTKAVLYNRTSGLGHNSASINLLVNVTSGDIFQIQGRVISGSGRIRTYAKGCRFMIKEIV